jgi:glycosyltransferase involved in cell wall biosynthesis
MHVVLAGHTYIVDMNRGKLDHLARYPDIELTVIVPRRWPHTLREWVPRRPESAGYSLEILDTWGAGRETRHFYFPRVTMGIRGLAPDIIQIDSGPWSLVCLQALAARRLFAPEAKVLFFTWWSLEYSLSPAARAVELLNFRYSDWAIAGNQDAARLLKEHGFTKGVTVLPQLGVDPGLYRDRDGVPVRERLGLEDAFVVGFVGRITRQKGIDSLLDAVSDLDSIHVVIVGRGPYRPALEQTAVGLGIGGRVHFVGAVPHDEVPDYISAFDVLVLPSRTTAKSKEQFGHVLIEAMAAQVPVIGSSSGEIPNVIGDAGLVFPEEDSAALRGALQGLIADEHLRRDLARRGHERVLRHYTNRRIAHEMRDIYRQLLGQSQTDV